MDRMRLLHHHRLCLKFHCHLNLLVFQSWDKCRHIHHLLFLREHLELQKVMRLLLLLHHLHMLSLDR
jgi:hypothetical protein